MLEVKSFEFSPIQENTYLIYNEFNECAIIDPGCYYSKEEDEIAGFIKDKKLNPILLLNTHCHLDHVFGNKFIAETYGLKLHIHAGEKQVLDFAPTSGLMYNLPFDNYAGEIIFLEEGKELRIGRDVLKILLTPGHSPASLSFYAAQGFVISGDVLFEGSIGRTDLPGGDYDTLISSVKNQLFTLPESTIVYPGHGRPTTIEKEMATNPFFN